MGAVSSWKYLRLCRSSQKAASVPWSLICARCVSNLQEVENEALNSPLSDRKGTGHRVTSTAMELINDLLVDGQSENEKGLGHSDARDERKPLREGRLHQNVYGGFGDRRLAPHWERQVDRAHQSRQDIQHVNGRSYDVEQRQASLASDTGRSDRRLPQARKTDPQGMKLRDMDKSQTNFRAISSEDFLSAVPHDLSRGRFREALNVGHLWRLSFEDPDRIWDDLMGSLQDRKLWEASYKHLLGSAQVKEIISMKKRAAAAGKGLRDLQQAVVRGEFQWQGKSDIYIQGEVRSSLERRAIKARVKRAMEEKDESLLSSMRHHFQDRLVQEVLRVVLEPVFEPSFAMQSHGFRIGRSQFSAFQQIRAQFQNCNWVFRSDLSSLFDLVINDRAIFRGRLKRLLEERIEDQSFLQLLLAGIDMHSIMGPEDIESRQPGVSPLSSKSGIVPLLCNIYFDRFDKWLQKRSANFNKGALRRFNPERLALLKDGHLKLAQATAILDPFDPNFRRMAFCRYADDFCVAFGANRPEAAALVEDMYEFLESDLHLTLPEGVKLLNLTSKPVSFLGHLIQKKEVVPEKEERMRVLRAHARACKQQWRAEEPSLKTKTTEDGTLDKEEVLRRLQHVPVVMRSGEILSRDDVIHASIRRVLSIEGDVQKMHRLLAAAGFCQKDGTPIPNFRYIHFTQNETNENVRKTLFGICDYLRAARNRLRLVHYMSDIMRHSLAKMFAAKFKLQSRRKVFKRGGKALSKWIKVGNPPSKKKNKEDEVEIAHEDENVLAAIPFLRGSHVPFPDLSHLPLDWEPQLIQELKDRVCGSSDQ